MRTVNPRISAKANESLNRRAAEVAAKKRILIIGSVILVSVIILLCSTVLTFAKSSNSDRKVYTEYTSIQIQSGDSLWSIAEENTDNFNVSVTDYIDEVKSMNQLKSDNIHAGQYLIVPEYHY